jgi:hypothetical protein
MPGSNWKSVEWRCSTVGCKHAVQQRFHVPTDGDPGKAEPPAPWTVAQTDDGSCFLCPDCSKRRAAEAVVEDDLTLAYADVPREAAEALWASRHLCLRCAHATVCRFAPDADGSTILVTISACGEFIAEPK